MRWVIWIIAAIFYSYEFFLRISPSVMVQDLMRSFAVDAAALGTLSALYYYAYASMQIPVGIMLDRFGIRRLLSLAAAAVAIGSFLFADTRHLWVAQLGRVMMGVGSAFSFVGCLKLATNWFSEKQFPVIVGLTNMLGVLGAIIGEAPLAYLVGQFGWRDVMMLAGIIGAMIALAIRLVVRDEPRVPVRQQTIDAVEPDPENSLWAGMLCVMKNRTSWMLALYGCLMVAPIAAFTELWSVPFFETVDKIARPEAAFISSMVFVGIAVGGPVNGWLSGFIGRRLPILYLGTGGAFISLMCILMIPKLALALVIILLFLFGFFSSSMLLIFALNTEINPSWASGVTIGFTNMIVMLGGTVFQPLVGWLLDRPNPVSADKLILHISTSQFQHALFILPLCQLCAAIIVALVAETYCQRTC